MVPVDGIVLEPKRVQGVTLHEDDPVRLFFVRRTRQEGMRKLDIQLVPSADGGINQACLLVRCVDLRQSVLEDKAACAPR
jgi:hypothetical protein